MKKKKETPIRMRSNGDTVCDGMKCVNSITKISVC